MNASADIKTKRHENVLSVPNTSVNARVKGSDQSVADKKKEAQDAKGGQESETNQAPSISDELEEVVFLVQADGTVKKTVVKSGIQDISYIEILSGLKGGEQVITGPYTAISKTLKDGVKVKVVPKEQLFEKK